MNWKGNQTKIEYSKVMLTNKEKEEKKKHNLCTISNGTIEHTKTYQSCAHTTNRKKNICIETLLQDLKRAKKKKRKEEKKHIFIHRLHRLYFHLKAHSRCIHLIDELPQYNHSISNTLNSIDCQDDEEDEDVAMADVDCNEPSISSVHGSLSV